VAVAFDLKAPTFRHKMYDGYKATRKPMPTELRPQIPLLKSLLTLMGVKCLEKEGVEADDIIGTVAKKSGIKTFIYTGDKDSFQLVDDKISVCFTKRGITEIELYSKDTFTEKTGIIPSQIIDLKSLMGDSSDNIPGIPGVGEKTAKTLLQTYGTLNGVYEHVDELKGKLAEKVSEGKDSAYLSYTLATINVDCGIDFDLNDMTVNVPFSTDVKERFVELEFKTLYKREDFFENSISLNNVKQREIAVIELSPDKPFNAEKSVYSLIVSDKSVNVSDGESEYVIKLFAGTSLLDEGVSISVALGAVKGIFEGGKTLITYDKKETLKQLISCGVKVDATVEDASLIKYLVDFTGVESFADVIEEYGENTETPATALFNVFNELKAKSDEKSLKLYRDLELPLSDVLSQMEDAGFKVDAAALAATGEKYKAFIAESESKIREMTGEPELNVNSPSQLGEVLFGKMKIGSGKKTKRGYSTTAEVLEQYEDANPVVGEILKYRKIQKLYSTYVEGIKTLIDGKTGLIHTVFNQTVTATGRLSSKEPNLQNIPVRDDEGRELRKFFVPRTENGLIIGADYSQIELRLLAAYSGCKGLIAAFNAGEDVHASTAAKVFGVPLKDVTPKMRREAKAVNFGIIYGISEYGLAKNIKTSPAKAKEYIDSYFKQFPEVKEYMRQNVEFARKNGYAITAMGRRRYIREINSGNYNLRQFGERVAMNMPLQGSAADIIKVAMLKVAERIKKENLKSKLILQVHDELIIDAVSEEKEQIIKLLKEEMESAADLPVKLTVEVGVGKTWYDAK
ncbi:MAG: DNA polymerase I, partial [Clostridia bacterium]|nr:DNA polymerase I [Clostridia bacterium]